MSAPRAARDFAAAPSTGRRSLRHCGCEAGLEFRSSHLLTSWWGSQLWDFFTETWVTWEAGCSWKIPGPWDSQLCLQTVSSETLQDPGCEGWADMLAFLTFCPPMTFSEAVGTTQRSSAPKPVYREGFCWSMCLKFTREQAERLVCSEACFLRGHPQSSLPTHCSLLES